MLSMTYRLRRLRSSLGGIVAAAAACGCGSASQEAPSDAGAPDAYATPYAAQCADAGTPPDTIECTGLYADVVTKQVAPGIRSYAPAVPLWADGSGKERWIFLPPGTKIDASDPDEWTFPVGTKVWKQFSRNGKRVETRFFDKIESGYWVRTTYAWNADETEATMSPGETIPWGTDGGTYQIPTGDECDQCHRGRTDRLLGFEQVSLGLAGATGLTLQELVAENLISPAPALTKLVVGDDGTGVAAAPLEWLHINCGVSCHNDNPNSSGYGSSMRLRLEPTLLDGGPSTDFDSRTTTINVLANNPMWSSHPRIVPGNPSQSLLVTLITNRGTSNPANNQMPPIATNVVDTTDSQNVITWISDMPASP